MSAARRPLVGLLIVGLGTGPAALDTSVNIAFPSMTASFAIELGSIQWVVVCYMLTYGGLMLVFGKLGDLFGHRRVFRVGLAATAVGLLACGLASSYGWLLAGRALQGVGIAITLSCGPALAISLYPESLRTRALAAYGGLFAIGTALGPLLGGVLEARWGWSAVFFYRVPLALIALALSCELPTGRSPRRSPGFDALSSALLSLVIGSTLLALISLQWDTWLGGLLAMVAFAGIAAFVARQRNATEPIIPVAAIRDAGLNGMHFASVAVNAASFAILLLVPYYLTDIAGLPAGWGGLLLSVSAVGSIAGSLLAGRLAPQLGSHRIARLGSFASAAGLAAIASWSQRTEPLMQAAALLLQGAGLGLFLVAYSDLVIAAMPAKDRGVAGSLVMVMRTMGVVAGASGLSALFQRAHQHALARGLLPPEALLAAFQSTFTCTWIGLVATLALSFAGPRIWLARSQR